MATNNPVRRIAASASDLAVLNAETTGKVLLRQTEAFEDVVKASVEQVKTLLGAESLRDAVNAQQHYFQTLGEHVRATGRDNWDTIRTAGAQARNVVRSTFDAASNDVREAAQETVNELRDDAHQAINQTANKVEDFVADNDGNTQEQQPTV